MISQEKAKNVTTTIIDSTDIDLPIPARHTWLWACVQCMVARLFVDRSSWWKQTD